MSSASKELKPLLQELRAQGWDISKNGQGHWRAAPADKSKSPVIMSSSGDPHAVLNNIKMLKERGFIWPIPSKKEQAVTRRLVFVPFEQPRDNLLPAEDTAEEPKESEVRHSNNPTSIALLSQEAPTACESSKNLREETPRQENLEQSLEKVFSELRDARVYHSLVEEDFAAKQHELEEAQARLDSAAQERAVSAASLLKKKQAFDLVFSADTPAAPRGRGRPPLTPEQRVERKQAG